MGLRKLLILQIVLAIVALLIVLLYLWQTKGNYLPQTEVYFTNTTIIGKVLGI